MGGAVGLKGTDGKAIVDRARSLGAKPVAPIRAQAFLSELKPDKSSLQLVVGAGSMGEDEAKSAGFTYKVLGKRKKETSAEDTVAVAKKMVDAGIALLVFCGGDGTARDLLNAVDKALPVLGVPTGVKMHSAVFAVNPQAAARVVMRFLYEALPLREAEVMDVDERAFREGSVSAELYGYVLAPYEPHLIQANKLASPMTESELRNHAAIGVYIIENMKPDVIYIIGPGTTTRTIGDLLDAKKTLLGVDLFCDRKIVASDVNEKQILEAITGKPAQMRIFERFYIHDQQPSARFQNPENLDDAFLFGFDAVNVVHHHAAQYEAELVVRKRNFFDAAGLKLYVLPGPGGLPPGSLDHIRGNIDPTNLAFLARFGFCGQGQASGAAANFQNGLALLELHQVKRGSADFLLLP